MKIDWAQKDLLEALKAEEGDEISELREMLGDSLCNPATVCDELVRLRDSLASSWDAILQATTKSDDEILQDWQRKRDAAANAGTWTHAMIEHCLNGFHVESSAMCEEFAMVLGFLENQKHCKIFRTKWCIFAEDEGVAGCIDCVLQDPSDGKLILNRLEEK